MTTKQILLLSFLISLIVLILSGIFSLIDESTYQNLGIVIGYRWLLTLSMLLLISCIFIIFYHYFDTKQKNEKPNKNWKKISENYELKEISTGIHIYVSKNKDKNNIYLCPNCFNDKIESFFQFGASIGPAQQLFCPRCHLKLRVNKNDLNSLKTVAKRSSLSSFI